MKHFNEIVCIVLGVQFNERSTNYKSVAQEAAMLGKNLDEYCKENNITISSGDAEILLDSKDADLINEFAKRLNVKNVCYNGRLFVKHGEAKNLALAGLTRGSKMRIKLTLAEVGDVFTNLDGTTKTCTTSFLNHTVSAVAEQVDAEAKVRNEAFGKELARLQMLQKEAAQTTTGFGAASLFAEQEQPAIAQNADTEATAIAQQLTVDDLDS